MRKASSKISAVAFVVLMPLAAISQAQNTIVTVAGGGPNNIPALVSSIGLPYGIAEDPFGYIYVPDLQSNRVFKIDPYGNLTVFAGNSVAGYSGDGALAVNAELFDPMAVAADSYGNVFIVDNVNCVIREVSGGIISTVAGIPGSCGYNGDGIAATAATLNNPEGVLVDAAGDIFIADTGNSVVREVTGGIINTIAGTPLTPGFWGDGGSAIAAQLNSPEGVSVDPTSGNILIADTSNSVIRQVVPGTGNISTVAGTPGIFGYFGDGGLAINAQLNSPHSVFVDGSSNLFIADTFNAVIREVSSGSIQTVAGNNNAGGYSGDGGPATSAGLNGPQAVWVDGAGNMFIADGWNYVIREVSSGTIQTMAGNHTLGYSGDGSLATNAELFSGRGLAIDASGNLFIADVGNCVVRRVDAVTGMIATFAGNGVCGFGGDGGPAFGAQLYFPEDVFLDSTGNLFVADSNNAVIREVVASTGFIQTVAGNGSYGYSGDNGPATSAQLDFPEGIAVDAAGNLFIADTDNNVIRKVTAATQNITTIAGTGTPGFNGDNIPATAAQLLSPVGIAVDNFGNIFFADWGNQRVREIVAKTGLIQTVAGNGTQGFTGDGGPATSAELDSPWGVYVDAEANIFISMGSLSNPVIRQVFGPGGNIQTVAGTGTYGFSGDNGPALSAELSQPTGITADQFGNLLVSDVQALRVRRISSLATPPPSISIAPASLIFSSQLMGTTSAAQTLKVTDTSPATMNFGNIVVAGPNAADFSESDNCASGLLGGNFCNPSITFTPSGPGPRSATLSFTDNALSSPQLVPLSGVGVTTTTTALRSSANPSNSGQSVTLTATVASAAGNTPTGAVNFLDGTTTMGSANLNAGIATYTTSALALGQHSITAAYAGDSSDTQSTSKVLSLTVNAAAFALSAAPTGITVAAGKSAPVTVTVTPQGSFTSQISFACSGLPTLASCIFSPTTLTPSASAVSTTLTINTAASSAYLAFPARGQRSGWRPATWVFLPAMLLGMVGLAAPKRRRVLICFLVCLVATGCVLQIACTTVNNTTSGGGGGGTPAGTYTVTVTGTAGSSHQTATVTLTVQ